MLIHNLFDEILIEPAKAGGDRLVILSGYAAPSMVFQHLQTIADDVGRQVPVDLIVGMTAAEGIARLQHQQFQDLQRARSGGLFQCWYLATRPPAHIKCFLWLRDGRPFRAFTGSGNYTHNGFFYNREAFCDDDPQGVYQELTLIKRDAISCLHPSVRFVINISDNLVPPRCFMWVS